MVKGYYNMQTNQFSIKLSTIIIIIFGGVFIIRYLRADEFLLDQLIGAVIGVILLVASLLWRKTYLNKK